MKVLIPDGGTIVIGGILDVLLEIVRILIGLLLPAIQA